MPSLIGTTVTANYLKTVPTTQFGTRKISVINIAISAVDTNYADANSLFTKSVRALQQTAEVWAVFTPTSGAFNAVIATHTQWAGDSAGAQQGNIGQDGTGYGILETAIAAGNGGTAATVTDVSGCGQILA